MASFAGGGVRKNGKFSKKGLLSEKYDVIFRLKFFHKEVQMFGFFRVAAAVPELRTADVAFNTDRIVELIKDAARKNVAAVVFPELSVTGASCGDLFWQTRLIEWSERALLKIAAAPT